MASAEYAETYVDGNVRRNMEQRSSYEEFNAYENENSVIGGPPSAPAMPRPQLLRNHHQQNIEKPHEMKKYGLKWLTAAFVIVSVIFAGMFVAVFSMITTGREQGKSHKSGPRQACRGLICPATPESLPTHGIDTVKPALDCFMGMKSGSIPDSAITASSFVDEKHRPERARLDTQKDSDRRRGAWSAASPGKNVWIQVDLGTALSVAGIISQGRADTDQWVKSYKVKFGNSTYSLQYVSSGGSIKIYSANTDQDTKVVNIFPKKLTSRFIRIYPETWWNPAGPACMRFELIRGECFDEYYIFQ